MKARPRHRQPDLFDTADTFNLHGESFPDPAAAQAANDRVRAASAALEAAAQTLFASDPHNHTAWVHTLTA